MQEIRIYRHAGAPLWVFGLCILSKRVHSEAWLKQKSGPKLVMWTWAQTVHMHHCEGTACQNPFRMEFVSPLMMPWTLWEALCSAFFRHSSVHCIRSQPWVCTTCPASHQHFLVQVAAKPACCVEVCAQLGSVCVCVVLVPVRLSLYRCSCLCMALQNRA